MKKIIEYLKRETVLCVATFLALVSMFFVKPDRGYADYLDARVLALLFCLMTVMEGFKKTGLFEQMANGLLKKVKTFRQLMIVLVGLCFFSSMWITNDVALLTFVPFTILVLRMAQMEQQMIAVVTMETIAANLGSMATPVGNPQNLYLYSVSGMSLGEFIKVMGPLSVLSLMLILAGCLAKKNEKLQIQMVPQIKKEKKTGEKSTFAGGISGKSTVRSADFILAGSAGDYSSSMCIIICNRKRGVFTWKSRLRSSAHLCSIFHIYRKYGKN